MNITVTVGGIYVDLLEEFSGGTFVLMGLRSPDAANGIPRAVVSSDYDED